MRLYPYLVLSNVVKNKADEKTGKPLHQYSAVRMPQVEFNDSFAAPQAWQVEVASSVN